MAQPENGAGLKRSIFGLTLTVQSVYGLLILQELRHFLLKYLIQFTIPYYSRSNLQRITAPNSVAATRLRLSGPNCSELILPHRALPGQASKYDIKTSEVFGQMRVDDDNKQICTYSEGGGQIVIQDSDAAVISAHSNVP